MGRPKGGGAGKVGYDAFTIKQLKALLTKNGHIGRGKKADLISQLQQHNIAVRNAEEVAQMTGNSEPGNSRRSKGSA